MVKMKKILKTSLLLAPLALFVSTAHNADAAMTSSGVMIVVPEYVKAEEIVKKGDFANSIDLLKETLRQYPGHASAYNLLGYVHRRLGKFDEAEKYYNSALTINPNHIGTLSYMGQLFIQTGRPEKAKALLEHLANVCQDGCEELDQLQKAVTTGVAGNY